MDSEEIERKFKIRLKKCIAEKMGVKKPVELSYTKAAKQIGLPVTTLHDTLESPGDIKFFHTLSPILGFTECCICVKKSKVLCFKTLHLNRRKKQTPISVERRRRRKSK